MRIFRNNIAIVIHNVHLICVCVFGLEYGKAMVAYSDDAVWIVFVPLLAYTAANSIVLQVRIGSRNPSQQITDFVFQAAVPKVRRAILDSFFYTFHLF